VFLDLVFSYDRASKGLKEIAVVLGCLRLPTIAEYPQLFTAKKFRQENQGKQLCLRWTALSGLHPESTGTEADRSKQQIR